MYLSRPSFMLPPRTWNSPLNIPLSPLKRAKVFQRWRRKVPVVFRSSLTFASAAKIERQAGQISDPIERLRYLRQATATATPPRSGRRWTLLASFVLAVVVVPLNSISDANVRRTLDPKLPLQALRTPRSDIPSVWLVDKTNEFEIYSNGLRVENRLSVSAEPRWYSLIARGQGAQFGPRRSQPAGIVFHTTESDQAPFQPDQNHALQRIGKDLLLFVRNKRAYHFLIDRFGRVHRIVNESDAANHAGNSVWADSSWLYLNLNASFLGVAFEARTEPDQPPVNPTQIHAAKVLTEMLRSKYNVPAENCVTHAQVSVNPSNMRIGWHTDWGKSFPFEDIGLPDNYEQPSPAISVFGFAYDATYMQSTSPALWKGLALADERIREAAAIHGLEAAEYRRLLQKRYRNQLEALRDKDATEEN
jgi:N-acetylmuramoyl-L-alanine amidase